MANSEQQQPRYQVQLNLVNMHMIFYSRNRHQLLQRTSNESSDEEGQVVDVNKADVIITITITINTDDILKLII